MSAPPATRLLRQSTRAITKNLIRSRQLQSPNLRLRPAAITHPSIRRCLSTVRPLQAGIMPDSEDPKAPVNEAAPGSHITQPTEISDEEYHTLADEYLDAVHEKAEQLQEGREDVDVEYSSGVMNITFPPNGIYVLNKQPPNKQIWISSPISGPKRYDWVLSGESMHQKEGSGNGEWVYLRDGTNLTSLLNRELGILIDPHAGEMKESKDPVE